MKTNAMDMNRIPGIKLLFSLLVLCLTSLIIRAQEKESYKIVLKTLKPSYQAGVQNRPKLKLLVTVTNPGKEQVDFGAHLQYSYKKYHDHEYYLEAERADGTWVDIDGDDDIDWITDPFDGDKRNINMISDSITTDIYRFKPGKYKIRWVYDPANRRLGPTTRPVYSNWENVEISE